MNRWLVVVPLALVAAVLACNFTPATLASSGWAPTSPDWVNNPAFGWESNPDYQGTCYTDAQSIIPSKEGTQIPLRRWQIGQLQLNNGKLTESVNVTFYNENGEVISDYSKMDRKVFYNFVVTGDEAYFVITLRARPFPLEGSTHLRLARLP